MNGPPRLSLATLATLAALGTIFCPAPVARADLTDECLCEQTGGTWDSLSCGHYTCGEFPDCDAIIPGCDCGPGRTFVPGLGCLADPSCDPLGPVLVIVDMDAAMPGVQRTVRVPACTTVVEDVAVYIIDPLEQRTVWSIGYRGALERGIAFGHAPSVLNAGAVMGIAGAPHTPINPNGIAEVIASPFFDAGLAGPEVQYVESGARAPAVIPSAPTSPIFTADVALAGAQPGDRFAFHLLDMVTVWSGGLGGAFSTVGPLATLDTGGDAVPDATVSLYGVDPDPGLPAPPAAFFVDYIDGPPATGPAIIEIVAAAADLDGDGVVGFADLSALLAAWGPCAPPPAPCPSDLDGDGGTAFPDLTRLLGAWGGCG